MFYDDNCYYYLNYYLYYYYFAKNAFEQTCANCQKLKIQLKNYYFCDLTPSHALSWKYYQSQFFQWNCSWMNGDFVLIIILAFYYQMIQIFLNYQRPNYYYSYHVYQSIILITNYYYYTHYYYYQCQQVIACVSVIVGSPNRFEFRVHIPTYQPVFISVILNILFQIYDE